MKLPQKTSALLLATSISMCSSALSQTFSFYAYETGGVANLSDLDAIELAATFTQNGSSVDVVIANVSIPGNGWVSDTVPTITKIAFDDGGLILTNPVLTNNLPNVEFVYNNSVNIPGSNRISFETTYGFTASPPPTTTGIDPNESLRITFANSSVDTLVSSVRSGDLRIAMHVQQIGKNDSSAAFVNTVPEPSSALLLGLAGFAGLVRRKR